MKTHTTSELPAAHASWFPLLVRLRGPAIRSVCAVSIGVGLWQTSVSVAERPHFDSKGRDAAIAIDGRYDDWNGNLQPFGANPVSVQFLNDGEYLYVRLTASDAATRMQIMRLGLTAWFDPGGGTGKHLGIRYPVVERGGPDGEQRGGRTGGFGGRGGRPGGDEPAPEEAPSPSDRIDILGPGKNDARSLTREHLPGVDVAIRAEQGTLQYELRVPLARTTDRPYAIETVPGKTIGFGLETGKMEQHSFGSGGSGRGGGFGGGGGGMGGGGRGRGGGGMGRGSGGGGDRPVERVKPLKGWGTVTIAPVR